MTDPAVVRIAAALLMRADGRMLVVRKRDTGLFMQPGGKIEPGETPVRALVRELLEELGLAVDPSSCRWLGQRSAPAAFEAGRVVEADLFVVAAKVGMAGRAEIAEVAWIDPADPGDRPLAALTREHVLPLARDIRVQM